MPCSLAGSGRSTLAGSSYPSTRCRLQGRLARGMTVMPYLEDLHGCARRVGSKLAGSEGSVICLRTSTVPGEPDRGPRIPEESGGPARQCPADAWPSSPGGEEEASEAGLREKEAHGRARAQNFLERKLRPGPWKRLPEPRAQDLV